MMSSIFEVFPIAPILLSMYVQDPHPEHGSVPGSPEKGAKINKRIYSLKHQLRDWLPRKFQLHSSQNTSEAEREVSSTAIASRGLRLRAKK